MSDKHAGRMVKTRTGERNDAVTVPLLRSSRIGVLRNKEERNKV